MKSNRSSWLNRIQFGVDIKSMFFSNLFGTVKWRKLMNTLEWIEVFAKINGTTATDLTISVPMFFFSVVFKFSLFLFHIEFYILAKSDDAFFFA